MSTIFTLLFFVSIATVAKSFNYLRGQPPQPEDSVCGKYGVLEYCGSECWAKCSSYDRSWDEGCLAVCGSAQCLCHDGYIIDDEADHKCVLPERCKRNSKNKESHKKSSKNKKNHDSGEKKKDKTIPEDQSSS